ncbi:MAG: tRNA guanosine(34) transglycosylase Tgt, partial [Acidimicrobiales bacterium]
MRASFAIEASDGSARAGHVQTARGSFPTPCFMPVGTRGAVRHLTSLDLEALDAHVVLANTYHLMLRPGADVVESLGGLHGFTRWNRHMLTDSGGYQVFSLEPKVDEEGATFRSVYDGSTHILTPESAVLTQSQLGADIQMVLDVCPGLPAPEPVLRKAVDTSALWAGRARHQFLSGASHEWQCQFGIVQGGTDLELRQESAERTVEMGFDGYAVGGLSVGEQRNEMVPALGVVTELLPADQPRYFMGLGDPVGIVEAV